MISKVFMICDAYEAGYGKGQQLRQVENPYLETSECYEAWNIGYKLGSKRALAAYKDTMKKIHPKPLERRIDLGKYAGTYGGYTP